MGFFYLTQFRKSKLVFNKFKLFALFNNSSLSYIVLALTFAATNVQNIAKIFHDFPGPTIKFHDFPCLGNEILKFSVTLSIEFLRWFLRRHFVGEPSGAVYFRLNSNSLIKASMPASSFGARNASDTRVTDD